MKLYNNLPEPSLESAGINMFLLFFYNYIDTIFSQWLSDVTFNNYLWYGYKINNVAHGQKRHRQS